jgi:hypothetical protein
VSDTPRPADHQAFDQLAVGWALHALEPEDETLFARHLPDCQRCARTVADTEEVMAALATDLPLAEPSEDLRHRLRAAVARTEQVRRSPAVPSPAPQDAAPPRSARRSDAEQAPVPPAAPVPDAASSPAPPPRSSALRERGWALALAAAVAGVVGLGIWNVALNSERDRAQEVAAEQSAVVEELLRPGARVLARLDGDDGPVATVVAQDGDLQVVTSGLAVNDDTRQTYVLWGIRDGDPEAIGAFDVVRSGLGLDDVGSSATGPDAYQQFAVSLEPGRQPPPAPSEVLAIGQVTS